MLLPMVNLLLAALPAFATTVAAPVVDIDTPQVIVVAGQDEEPLVWTTTNSDVVQGTVAIAGDEPGTMRTFVIKADEADDADGQHRIIVRAHPGAIALSEADLPKVWIGVRVTPVPAPLAAHIGGDGAMIANVVKDSPADAAGLEQYDVLVRFGQTDIAEPQDLTAAVGAMEAGQQVQLEIIRKGQGRQLTVKPAERDAAVSQEMKYDEPADVLADAAVNLRGRAFQLGPQGNWVMRDLGPLHGLDALKDLDIDVDVNLDDLFDPDVFGRDMDIKILRELNAEDGDKQVRVEVKVQTEDDGSSTTVQRDADGRFHVTHTDPQGKETSATYDSEEAFRAGDAQAWKVYSQHAAHDGAHVVTVRPFGGGDTQTLRKEFQIDIQQRVKEAMDRAKEAAAKAQQRADEALRDAGIDTGNVQRKKERRIEIHQQNDGTSSERLMVMIDDDGTIHVTAVQDGEKQEYEFSSKQEFQREAPDLYERLKGMFE